MRCLELMCFTLLINSVQPAKRVKRIFGGVSAAPPPPDDPVVFVQLFGRTARVEGFRDSATRLYSFLGVNYAEPPIGPYRFDRPRYKRLSGDINATRYGPPCPQPDPQNPRRIVGTEDCLLLNVYTPRMPDESTGIPVLVFIHGGGYRYGSANQYGPDGITAQQVIFVPIQYRLGTLGALGEGTKEFPGNVALFDMYAAIRWVNEYISYFGGDPKKVTVIGHGSGAAAANYLSMSRQSRSSVSGVVAMSGTALSQYMIDEEPTLSVQKVAEINECDATNETVIVKCLQMKSVDDIISHDSDVETERLHGKAMVKSLTGASGFRAVVEKDDDYRGLPGFITEEPKEAIKAGNTSRVPLLTGVTKDETAGAINLKSIESIFSSATEFLGAISNTLGLDSFVNVKGLLDGIVKPVLPGIDAGNLPSLSDYLKIPDSLSPEAKINKITEVTTDALFNLPAVLIAETWGKFAPAYLYSFEHIGNKSSGSNFLSQLPLVGTGKKTGKVSHGDELGYLFDARDLYGNPIIGSELTDPKDLKARHAFTDLIAKFAYYNGDPEAKGNALLRPFDSKGSSFIKVGETAEVKNDFRFCELSMWGAKLESLTAASCGFLLNQLGGLGTAVTNLTSDVTGTLGGLGGGLLGLGGGKSEKQKQRPMAGLGLF